MSNRTPAPSPITPPGSVTHYRDHILDELRHDPYQAKQKYPDPTRCPECGLVFRHGRWEHGISPDNAHLHTCPACQRIADRLPAGFVTITGPFAKAHRAEIAALVRHQAEYERNEHPLHRLMSIAEGDETMEVTTTDLHLPRRVGEALKNAYGGSLELRPSRDEFMLRVRWSR